MREGPQQSALEILRHCLPLFGLHVGEWCDSGDPDYFECSACGYLVRVKD